MPAGESSRQAAGERSRQPAGEGLRQPADKGLRQSTDESPTQPTGEGLGQLSISVFRSDGPGGLVLPWPADTDPAHDDALYAAVHARGSVTVARDGAEVPLAAGDIVFCAPGRPGLPRFGDDVRMTVFRIPRACLGITESELRRLTGASLSCADGVPALVSNFLTLLASEVGLRRTRIGDRLARNAVDLLAVLVTELLGARTAEPADVGAQTLSRIRDFVELHLTDPDLSPESIALAHHISVRYLHKLFQGEDTTVGQWVRQRRLDACRRDLGRAPHRRLTVAAVAHRWGFTSPSHFSRAFRGAYDMSPSEWQSRAAASDRLTPPAGNPSLAVS
ncbi:helix-turn-helix domain-containing protein [Streptomyces sp. NPDC005574]|uniref:helix-turn-helix domain-containing protein n=1 Tax=Streptomyces sp. NPDC005574 TaxID=3156891 RepID=UPI0033A88BBD